MKPASSLSPAEQPAVTIEREAFGCGFDVVAPDPAASREFPDVALARRYAVELADLRGWCVIDGVGR